MSKLEHDLTKEENKVTTGGYFFLKQDRAVIVCNNKGFVRAKLKTNTPYDILIVSDLEAEHALLSIPPHKIWKVFVVSNECHPNTKRGVSEYCHREGIAMRIPGDLLITWKFLNHYELASPVPVWKKPRQRPRAATRTNKNPLYVPSDYNRVDPFRLHNPKLRRQICYDIRQYLINFPRLSHVAGFSEDTYNRNLIERVSERYTNSVWVDRLKIQADIRSLLALIEMEEYVPELMKREFPLHHIEAMPLEEKISVVDEISSYAFSHLSNRRLSRGFHPGSLKLVIRDLYLERLKEMKAELPEEATWVF